MSSKQLKLRRHQNLRHGDNAVPADRLVTEARRVPAAVPLFPRISRARVEALLREARHG